jgi:hypothetical protein
MLSATRAAVASVLALMKTIRGIPSLSSSLNAKSNSAAGAAHSSPQNVPRAFGRFHVREPRKHGVSIRRPRGTVENLQKLQARFAIQEFHLR